MSAENGNGGACGCWRARPASHNLAATRSAGWPTAEALHPGLPITLSRLRAANAAQQDEAWSAFIDAHSDVVLHVCRSVAQSHDHAMDGYAYVLAALRQDDCRRLRAYTPDGQTKFTTWLAVVTRRLVLDYYRQRYGRPRSEDVTRRHEHATRRNLEELVAADIEPDQLESASSSPDERVRRAELTGRTREAIAHLPPRDRLLLALRFVDERSVREIQRGLGLPSVFHVYRRLKAVLAQLRSELARRGIDGTEP